MSSIQEWLDNNTRPRKRKNFWRQIVGLFKSQCILMHRYEEINPPFIPGRPIARGGIIRHRCVKCGKKYSEMWKM